MAMSWDRKLADIDPDGELFTDVVLDDESLDFDSMTLDELARWVQLGSELAVAALGPRGL